MFSKILIANRGEIALRIIRACREMNIETVAVYSEADRNAIYLRYADEKVCIGPAPSVASYLNIPNIISTAEITDVDAIHPGYGFLAENSHFAEVCDSSNITFIGPRVSAMAKVGNKAEARKIAMEYRIPVVPGSESTVTDENEAKKIARKIGYPVMLKAAAGGGGRGMRIAHNDISLANAFFVARHEAQAAFKDPSVYIEKYIENPRHVEIQVLADNYGNIIHLGERDCSLQRRHQKLIEESPSPGICRSTRDYLARAALKLAKAVNYSNAGTFEFLVDRNENYYFIEANARLQVEHPVTEMITGIDLVKEQIRIAAGERVGLKQRHVYFNGVSIECRINAEDPTNGFSPCPGLVTNYIPPGGPGVRVDTHIFCGYEIPPHYDALVGKLIVHKENRDEAISCMRRALQEYIIEGIKTTIPLYLDIFGHAQYIKGNVSTGFIEDFMESR
jgi:acetyl-CoA carboxylase biotin carboxylase subunit